MLMSCVGMKNEQAGEEDARVVTIQLWDYSTKFYKDEYLQYILTEKDRRDFKELDRIARFGKVRRGMQFPGSMVPWEEVPEGIRKHVNPKNGMLVIGILRGHRIPRYRTTLTRTTLTIQPNRWNERVRRVSFSEYRVWGFDVVMGVLEELRAEIRKRVTQERGETTEIRLLIGEWKYDEYIQELKDMIVTAQYCQKIGVDNMYYPDYYFMPPDSISSERLERFLRSSLIPDSDKIFVRELLRKYPSDKR